MSYIAGFHHDSSVCLVCDTAVTSYGPPEHQDGPSTSSFGDATFTDGNRTVREGRHKLHHLGQMAIACAGTQSTIAGAIQQLKQRLDAGAPPRLALAGVFEDWLPPGEDIEALATFVEDGDPRFVSFVTESPGARATLRDRIDEGAQSGSAPDVFQALTKETLSTIVADARFPAVPHSRLALVVAFAQSYAARNYLLPHGVGGAFAGIVCHPGGIDWLPDTLFLLVDGAGKVTGWVTTCFRGGAMILTSDYAKGRKILGNPASLPLSAFSDDYLAAELKEVDAGRFEYVTLVNLQCWNTAVVHMHRSRHLPQLRINLPEGQFGLEEPLRSSLMECLEGPHGGLWQRMQFVPYSPWL